jgi:hypothetical protein
MKTTGIILIAAVALLILAPDTSQAIPAFARKYGFNCNMCHTGFTKLNDFGQRVRDDGYQIPGHEGREANTFQIAPPISMRTSVGLMASHQQKNTSASFVINGLDLLAAGVLHKNISFLMIYTPRIDEPAADYTGPGEYNDNPSQPGGFESANIVFSNLVPELLNIRVGRFEPAYHPFSSKRSYYLLQPYEIYGFTTPNNEFVFDDNQQGVEATGHLKNGFKYAAGVINGSGGNPDINTAKDIYVNLYQTIGRGDGQSAGQRVGAFAYYGWQPTKRVGWYVGADGGTEGKGNVGFYRIGGDISLNWRTFNLMGMIMYGADDSTLNPYHPAEKYEFAGGFARLDYAGLMNNRMIASALFNWVNTPAYDHDRVDLKTGTALVRYYLGDWTAVNIALHGEFTYRRYEYVHPLEDTEFALFIDFYF